LAESEVCLTFIDSSSLNRLGRILNRFSADVGSNDDLLPQTLFDFTVILFIVIGAISTTVASLPFALLAIPPLLYYFVMVRRVFVTSTRELKRLEGLARSPIYAMMSESLSGVATIRANNASSYFTRMFEGVHDSHTRAFFSFIASSRWVGFRMDSLVFMLMSLVSFLSVLFQTQGWFSIDPAILGLSISMLLQLAGMFQWCIRQSAEVVNQMVSVERVLSFGKIQPEAPLELESDKSLDPNWPQNGAIDVKDLSVRYRPSLPLALDGATFSVPSGSRIGVVGRTGSGKSTVVQTLFRLLEADRGTIEIDNVNVANIGLHRLRTSISVIPQVPTLFSGCTVRENLDLFNMHSDESIHKALEDSHMSDAIAELPKGIHSLVSEGGSNFSVGQRQLLCLARAILSKNKLLVLDEATASVDRRTDQMLHESLHESFEDATIIAVAHRLDTVIENDYILVLGQGKVLEFGSPAELLRSGGAFSKMVDDTGDVTSKDLRQRAFNKASRDKAT
jgi:ATP-binding cassette, subfamily C (CFTR/MRP), member 4